MDCFVVLLLAMTKETRDSTLHIVIVIMDSSLRELLLQFVAISLWDTVILNQSPSLRGFEKAMAISLWQPPYSTHTIIARTTGSWQS